MNLRLKKEQSKKQTHYLYDLSSGLYNEEYFKDMLCLERKRTERSKKPFLLMTLNIGKILRAYDDTKNGENDLVSHIANTLLSVTRETDVKGWFKFEQAIGVIFTEINTLDAGSIEKKVIESLCTLIEPALVCKIKISFHFFPEEHDHREEDHLPNVDFYPDIANRNSTNRYAFFLKRVMDVTGSLFALLIFAPFFLIIPFLIKVGSKGPVLFKQERIGQFGKKFTFLKFRSMHSNNDPKIHQDYVKKLIRDQKNAAFKKEDGREAPSYKITNDPRVTRIGRFLRKTSLDELPQFFNVLKGEMSLVGPRPPIPYELANYDLWHRRRVLEVKPGITGLWQVEGRSRTTFDEMVRLDLQYATNWSLWLDIKILLKTVWVVLRLKGAY